MREEIRSEQKIPIISLGSEKLLLKKEIPIILTGTYIFREPDAGRYFDRQEYTAKFYDLEITGRGSTGSEAIDNIKKEIEELYFELIDDEANLDPLSKRWLVTFKEIIEEKPQEENKFCRCEPQPADAFTHTELTKNCEKCGGLY